MGKDARLWSQIPPISSSFLHAGNYLKLSPNSNNQTVPLYMTPNSWLVRKWLPKSQGFAQQKTG